MRILSRNISGVGRKGFKDQLRELIRNHNPDIIILMETKVTSEKAQTIIKNITFPNYTDVPPEGIWL